MRVDDGRETHSYLVFTDISRILSGVKLVAEYPYLSGRTQETGEHGSTLEVVSSKLVKLKILSSSRTLETR